MLSNVGKKVNLKREHYFTRLPFNTQFKLNLFLMDIIFNFRLLTTYLVYIVIVEKRSEFLCTLYIFIINCLYCKL